MLGLYFYRARRPSLEPDADLRDASCRPDPDFEWLTLGLCRPDLRRKIARLAAAEPVELLFYSRAATADVLLLVALMRVDAIYADHLGARSGFEDRIPRNLIVSGNPCLFGTQVYPALSHVTVRRQSPGCGCRRYVLRAGTPYFRFAAARDAIRLDSPVPVTLRSLQALSPNNIRRRWPPGTDLGSFQRATQNGAHWIRHPVDAEAIRRYFMDTPRSKLVRPRRIRRSKSEVSRSACGSD